MLLYFYRGEVEGQPAINLDKRIIDVLREGRFDEFKMMQRFPYFTAFDRYTDYLEKSLVVAQRLHVPSANLAMLPRDFGPHLKETYSSRCLKNFTASLIDRKASTAQSNTPRMIVTRGVVAVANPSLSTNSDRSTIKAPKMAKTAMLTIRLRRYPNLK